MTTITLEVPEEIARKLADRPDGNALALAAIVRALSDSEEGLSDEETLNDVDDDLRAAITEGLAELETGKGKSLEDYIAEQRAFWAGRGV